MRKLIIGISAALFCISSHGKPDEKNAEEQSWEAVSAAGTAVALEAYLTEYPKGRYAATARVKLNILHAQGNSSMVAPPSTAGTSKPIEWGLTENDLSRLPATTLLKKAGMPNRMQEMQRMAEAGDKIAQYLMGAAFELGIGMPRDPAKKVEWLSKAAHQGVTRARVALAIARIMGQGMPQNTSAGWAELYAYASSGNPIAEYVASLLVLQGIEDDNGNRVQLRYLMPPPAALAMLTRAAEAGMPYAQYSLGHAYLVGAEEVGGKNLTLARYWLQKAADQEVPDAWNALARINR